MLIYATSSDGQKWKAGTNKAANLIYGVPAGTEITGLHVDGVDERIRMLTDGTPILVSLPAIRRVRSSRKTAA